MKITKLFRMCNMMILFLFLLAGCSLSQEEFQVVSLNNRYNNPGDGINIWEARIPIIQAYFHKNVADIIGMQEVNYKQLLDLQKMLPEYAYVGTGRDDGKQRGEHSPVFYRKDKFKLIDHSQFWLSETPDVPGSKSWDASITRIVTWAKLESLKTGKIFFCFNTHFDHRGIEARKESVWLMSEKISEIAGDDPVIVTGDFNIGKRPRNVDNSLYDNLINTFSNQNSLKSSEFLSETNDTGDGGTFNRFSPEWRERMSYVIDYIFVSDHFSVQSYRVDKRMEGDVFISDHWPVVSVVNLN